MDYMFAGLVAFVAGMAGSLLLPGNRFRIAVSLLAQLIGCVCVLSCSIPVLFGAEPLRGTVPWSYPVEQVDLMVDSLGAFFLTFSLPLTFLGSLYAVGYLSKDIGTKRHVGTHFGLLALIQISYLILYSVQNAFAFMVGWEFAALGSWLLVIWYHRDQKIRFAGFNYLISTHFSLLFLVAAIVVMHGATNSFQFNEFQKFLSKPGFARNVTFVLLMICFAVKSGFFPFHTWLPRAYSAAPAHVSSLMTIHKAGIFGMLRVIQMMGEPEPWMGWFLIIVSCVSAFMGVLYTITQRDIKRLLGYSSTENVGIVGLGIGLGCLGLSSHQPTMVALGFGGAMLHVLNHSLFKCLLFYGAGCIYRFTHTIDLEKLGGLAKRMRWTTPMFLVGCMASAAMPPFNGFVSELLIYTGLTQTTPALEQGRLFLLLAFALLALVGGISALSFTRLFGLMFLGSPRDEHACQPGAKENAWMVLPMLLHTAGIMAIGFCPAIGIALVNKPTQLFMAISSEPTSSIGTFMPNSLLNTLLLGSLTLISSVAILFLLRMALLPRCQRRHVTWGCGYTAPNTRMQYSGSSFSDPMVSVFRDLLRFITRQELPQGVFPENGRYETHCVDAVERKIFALLSNGETIAKAGMDRLPEHSAFSFAMGLLALILLVCLVSLN